MTIMFYNCDNVSYAVNGIIQTFVEKAVDADSKIEFDAIKGWVTIQLAAGCILSKNNIEMLSCLLASYDYEVYTEAVVD